MTIARFQLRKTGRSYPNVMYRSKWPDPHPDDLARLEVTLSPARLRTFKLLKRLAEVPNASEDFGMPLHDAILAPWMKVDPMTDGETIYIVRGASGLSATWKSSPPGAVVGQVEMPIGDMLAVLMHYSRDRVSIKDLLSFLVLESWKAHQANDSIW